MRANSSGEMCLGTQQPKWSCFPEPESGEKIPPILSVAGSPYDLEPSQPAVEAQLPGLQIAEPASPFQPTMSGDFLGDRVGAKVLLTANQFDSSTFVY